MATIRHQLVQIPRPRRLTDVRKVTSKEKQTLRKQGIAQKVSEVMCKKKRCLYRFFIFKNILLFSYLRNNDTCYLFISIIIAITVMTHPITSNTGSASVKMKSKLSSSCFSFKSFMLNTSFPCISLIMNQIPLQCVTTKRSLLILG